MRAGIFYARVFASIFFAVAFSVIAVAQDPLRHDLSRSFSNVDVVRIDTGGELRTEGERKRLRIETAVRAYELIVEPHDLRSAGYRADDTNMVGTKPVERSAVTTYKGLIEGEQDSEVRLTIEGVTIEGFFETKSNGRLFIEPASKYSSHSQPGDSVIYRAEDSLNQEALLCEADIPQKIASGQAMAETTGAVAMLRVLELATEADLEFVNAVGGPAAANAEILSILNMVEGTYNAELNLSIQVVYQHTWSTPDPFSAPDMSGVLTAFGNYWNANFASIARDATHLFTAKQSAVSRGLAYVGVICLSPQYSYGLSGYVNWTPGKFLIPAHEIGHNLGAGHVDATQSCGNTLMNASLTTSTPLSFCSFSRNVITSFVATNGTCLSQSSPPPAAGVAVFDFDRDGRSDISVFRPTDGTWYVSGSSAGFSAFRFGLINDIPVAADYDGDGRADAAVYRSGVWYRFKSATGSTDVVNFGVAGDIPSPADLDGDGKSDIAVFRPSTGVWYWQSSASGNFSSVRFGLGGDVPVAGDYDGDGRDDINLYRPSTGTWYRLNSSTGAFVAMRFGIAEDKALAGDFDGDGRSDVAVWRPSTGVWYVARSSTGPFSAEPYGLLGDIPAPADYDGDGRTDIAVFCPSNGVWYRHNSGNGSYAEVRFGLAGDIPVPSHYIR